MPGKRENATSEFGEKQKKKQNLQVLFLYSTNITQAKLAVEYCFYCVEIFIKDRPH